MTFSTVNTSGVGCVCELGRDTGIFSIVTNKIKNKRKAKGNPRERRWKKNERENN